MSKQPVTKIDVSEHSLPYRLVSTVINHLSINFKIASFEIQLNFLIIDRVRWSFARGGIPLYKLYRYVPPHRVGFLRRFGLKTGIHFAHFGLESDMVFEGATECL